MQKRFDLTDLKIIEALALHGPRNVVKVSKKLHMPAETLRKRIKRLYTQTFLRFNVSVNYANLGLRRAVVFAQAVPGYEDALYDALKINDFWVFVSRCYGMFEGCVGIFAVPFEKCGLFESFISEFERVKLAEKIQIFWVNQLSSVQSRCKWFNEDKRSWVFSWGEWIEEIKEAKTLHMPKLAFSTGKVDKIDVLILKELEKDARISFKKLSGKIGVSPQLVCYHYHNHVVRGGLLKNFEVAFLHFGDCSDFFFFIFSFDDLKKLETFCFSLMDKPFVKAFGKIADSNQLYGYFYLPRSEFRGFLAVLSKLVKSGFLKRYEYVIQDLTNSSRATIPFQCFVDGVWVYDHERYMNILHRFSEERLLTKEEIVFNQP